LDLAKAEGLIMKVLWCWRCRKEVPMLEDDEIRPIEDLFAKYRPRIDELGKEIQRSAEAKREWNRLIEERDAEAMRLFAVQTGQVPGEPYDVVHHRASIYGPQCKQCGKVLRTPKASKCLECGWRVGTQPAKDSLTPGPVAPEHSEDQQVRSSEFARKRFLRTDFALGLTLSLYHGDDLLPKAQAVCVRLREWVEIRKRNAAEAIITVAGASRLTEMFAESLRAEKRKHPELKRLNCSLNILGGDASSRQSI
jgi:hypothetical protein